MENGKNFAEFTEIFLYFFHQNFVKTRKILKTEAEMTEISVNTILKSGNSVIYFKKIKTRNFFTEFTENKI